MDRDRKVKLWKKMYRIRSVEERIAAEYPAGKMRCPTHLSIGQEAVPAALSECVNPTDFAVSTHRGHAHYLAKGGDLRAMIAELHGKSTGCSKARGGSMHLVDPSVGFMGTTAIVGNSIPIGVGLALSAQLKGTDQISIVFVGDGAIEEGVFYESANFAAVRNLPTLFICENNLYSVYSPLSVRQPKDRSISKLAEAIGLNTATGDGNNVIEAFEIIDESVIALRNGKGPFLLEFYTYRILEHCGPNYDNDLGYRSLEEFEKWKEKDPIKYLEKAMQGDKYFFEQIQLIRTEVDREIEKVFNLVRQDTFPDTKEAYYGVYAI
ncbi:MAG: thiamine pyrophosphate-dependent dehydrogenase E1 component subunit alpha [Xenococcaceae cyanobacterium]